MKNRIRILSLLMLVGLVALLPACSSSAVGEPALQQEVTSLKVATFPYLSFLPFYIAQQEGYFAEQNLDVELVTLERSVDVVAALTQGQIDVGTGLMTAGLFNAIDEGAEVRFVSDKSYIAPDGCLSITLMVTPEMADAPMESLAGKSIGISSLASYNEYFADLALHTGGLSVDDVSLEPLAPAVFGESLQSGQLSAVLENEPFLTRLLDSGQGVVYGPSGQELLPNGQLSVLLYGPNLLEKDPDAGRRFMVAYLKSVRQYNEGKTERNLQLMAEFTGDDPDVLQRACWSPSRSDLSINVDDVLAFQRWTNERGYFDGSLTADEFLDFSFAEYALSVADQ